MIEPRIYRAAFLPVLFAVVVAMFSLENRPAPAPQGLAADVLFDGRLARTTLRGIVGDHPDRSPGSAGNAAVAERVARQFAERGFDPVVRRRFTAEGERLENVVARRPGRSREQIVIMAGRDSPAGGGPDATGSAADTAALLELARVFEGRPAHSTIVLMSFDGATLGYAGVRRFVERAEDPERIRAVIVLSNLGASRSRGPLVVDWSNDSSRGSIGLARTAAVSLREELGGVPAGEGPAGQLARLAFPVGIGAQGVLIEQGIPAVRISGSGELPPPRTGLDDLDVDRLGALGRAALRTASAVDAARTPGYGPSSYVIAARNVLPGWAIALLAGALLVPPLIASVDAAARVRRRRLHLGRWWRWALAGAAPFVLALALAELLALVGLLPDAPPAPIPPGQISIDAAGAVALGLIAAALVGSWVLVRPRLMERRRRRRGSPEDLAANGRAPEGAEELAAAGAVTALALSVAALAVWIVNPYAALLLVPAVHLWMLAMVAEPSRPAAGLLVGLGLLLPAGVAVYYLARLSLDPLEGAWYLLMLVTGHHVGLPTVLLGGVLLGLLGSTIAIVAARGRREEARPAGPPLRGPASYAGPGSLGGTESALRR